MTVAFATSLLRTIHVQASPESPVQNMKRGCQDITECLGEADPHP